ncbi:hypothetical protein Tco_0284950 [Tanacetum coccineum]
MTTPITTSSTDSPYQPTTVVVLAVATTDDSPEVPQHTAVETILNMTPDNKAYFQAEKEAIFLLLTRIRDEIYSTIDAFQTANEIHKGKKVAKTVTPLSEPGSDEDSDPEQAQKDKEMQKNLALIAKYFKKLYKPTNNNLRTSSNSRNKTVDTSPSKTLDIKEDQTGLLVGCSRSDGVRCVKADSLFMFVYGLDSLVVALSRQGAADVMTDWLADMDEEVDEQELEAHYSYMAKIQEVLHADSDITAEPLEKDDSNVIPDSSNMCNNDNQVNLNDVECNDERVALANLIANLTLDTEQNKNILKQLKKANASLTQELKECKSNLKESIANRDSCLIALQTKQTELEKYIAFNDRTIDYDKLQIKLNETLGLSP